MAGDGDGGGGDGIVHKSISCLGRGFDFTSDFKLDFLKAEKLIRLNETDTRQIHVPGFGSFRGISVDVKCDKGDRTRYRSDILDFNQMSELFNRRSSVTGKIPSGTFNATFGFGSCSWGEEAARTKGLGMDGYFIELFKLHIDRYPLKLADEVRDEVPSTWDPPALARYIEKYGTHIVVGLSIGGQDVVVAKQDKCSEIEPSEIKVHLDELGDQLFTGACNFSPKINNESRTKTKKVPEAFNVFDNRRSPLDDYASIAAKDGIRVMCSRRGGDPSAETHCEWLLTVPFMPDAVNHTLIPITSLLKGVPGRGFLSHAVNLYLRYKPPIGELKYFLDFQSHKAWAPMHNDLPLRPTTISKAHDTLTPTLSFNFIGPKLYVNPTPVLVGPTPVTGMRLYLEGIKCDRLAVHLQHLIPTPTFIENRIHRDSVLWRGSDEADHRFFEPIQRKSFSHVCTSSVKFDPAWLDPSQNDAFIVTGAQLLHTKIHDAKTVLHLRLCYSRVSGCCVAQSNWKQFTSDGSSSSSSSSCSSQSLLRSGFFSSLGSAKEAAADPSIVAVDSAVYPRGPPVPVQTQKMLKFVNTGEICRGASDSPGHWLVTGAKLESESGRICLRVKFSLLNLCCSE